MNLPRSKIESIFEEGKSLKKETSYETVAVVHPFVHPSIDPFHEYLLSDKYVLGAW